MVSNFSLNCECGYSDGDFDRAEHCNQRGLRCHLTFRPPSLIDPKDEPSPLSYGGWKTGTLTPCRHWAYLGEVSFTFGVWPPISGPRTHSRQHPDEVDADRGVDLEVRSRYKLEESLRVVIDVAKCEQLIQQPRHGHTLVVLYPEYAALSGGEMYLLHLDDPSRLAFIRASLESVLEYSDSILRSERNCFACAASTQDALRCSQCRTAWYCNKACQKANWGVHKALCKSTMLVKQLIALPKVPFAGEYGRFATVPEGTWLCMTRKFPVHPALARGTEMDTSPGHLTPRELPWEEDVE